MATIIELRGRSCTELNIAIIKYNALCDCVYEGITKRPAKLPAVTEDKTNITIPYVQSLIDQTNAILPEIQKMSDYINLLNSKATECSGKLKAIGV